MPPQPIDQVLSAISRDLKRLGGDEPDGGRTGTSRWAGQHAQKSFLEHILVILVPPLWLPYFVIGIVMPLERPGDELGLATPRMRRHAQFRAEHGGGVGAALGGTVRRHVLRRS